eukprot:5372588-Amphidinium_carterae.1
MGSECKLRRGDDAELRGMEYDMKIWQSSQHVTWQSRMDPLCQKCSTVTAAAAAADQCRQSSAHNIASKLMKHSTHARHLPVLGSCPVPRRKADTVAVLVVRQQDTNAH